MRAGMILAAAGALTALAAHEPGGEGLVDISEERKLPRKVAAAQPPEVARNFGMKERNMGEAARKKFAREQQERLKEQASRGIAAELWDKADKENVAATIGFIVSADPPKSKADLSIIGASLITLAWGDLLQKEPELMLSAVSRLIMEVYERARSQVTPAIVVEEGKGDAPAEQWTPLPPIPAFPADAVHGPSAGEVVLGVAAE